MITTPRHPNVELLLRGYAGDQEVFPGRWADDIIVHAPSLTPSNPTSGVFYGKQAMLEHQQVFMEMSDGTLKVEPAEGIADDHFAAILGRITIRRKGRVLDQPVCGVYRFRGDLIAEHWENVEDPDEWDDFWTF